MLDEGKDIERTERYAEEVKRCKKSSKKKKNRKNNSNFNCSLKSLQNKSCKVNDMKDCVKAVPKLKELRIVLHDIAFTNLIPSSQRHLLKRGKNPISNDLVDHACLKSLNCSKNNKSQSSTKKVKKAVSLKNNISISERNTQCKKSEEKRRGYGSEEDMADDIHSQTSRSTVKTASNVSESKDNAEINNKKQVWISKNVAGVGSTVSRVSRDNICSSTSSSNYGTKNNKTLWRDKKYYKKNKLPEYDLNSNIITSCNKQASKRKTKIKITHSYSSDENSSTVFSEEDSFSKISTSSSSASSYRNNCAPRRRRVRRIASYSSVSPKYTNSCNNILPIIYNSLEESNIKVLKKKRKITTAALKPYKSPTNKNEGSFNNTQSLEVLQPPNASNHNMMISTKEEKKLEKSKDISSHTFSNSCKKKRKLPIISDDCILPDPKIKIVQINGNLQNGDSVLYNDMKIRNRTFCERGTSPIILDNSKVYSTVSRNYDDLNNVPKTQKLSEVDKSNDDNIILKQKNSFKGDSVPLHSTKMIPGDAVSVNDIMSTSSKQHSNTGNIQDLSTSKSLYTESQVPIDVEHWLKNISVANVKNTAACQSVTCKPSDDDLKLLYKGKSTGAGKNPETAKLTIKNIQAFTKSMNSTNILEEYLNNGTIKKNKVITVATEERNAASSKNVTINIKDPIKLPKFNQLVEKLENVHSEPTKKIKLNRTSWIHNVSANNKRRSEIKAMSITSDLHSEKQVSCSTTLLSVNAINNMPNVTETTQECLQVKKSESLNIINNDNVRTTNIPCKTSSVINQDEQDNVSNKIVPVPAMKNNSPKLDKEAGAFVEDFDHSKHGEIECNEAVDDDDGDDDAISLFADSSIFHPYTDIQPEMSQKGSKTSETYAMTGDVFEKYVQSNKCEFNTEYEANMNNNEKCYSSCKAKEIPNMEQKIPVIVRKIAPATLKSDKCSEKLDNRTNYLPSSTLTGITAVNNSVNNSVNEDIGTPRFFFLYQCFIQLRKGVCHLKRCRFKHSFQQLIQRILESGWNIQKIVDYTVSQNYYSFTQELYKFILPQLSSSLVIDMCKKLYNAHILSPLLVSITITELLAKKLPLHFILLKLTEVILPEDSLLLMHLIHSVEYHIKPGEYWKTLNTLLLKYPNKHRVERVLQECLQFHLNVPLIQDVHKRLISNLHPILEMQIDNELLKSFDQLTGSILSKNCRLVQHTSHKDPEKKEIVHRSIVSPDLVQSVDLRNVINLNKPIIVEEKNIQKRAAVESGTFTLHPIDNLPEPTSIYRNKFWKFYVDLHSLREGLKNEDYDHVIQILNKALEKNEQSLYVKSCYSILCAEIKRSQKHLSNIIARTAQTGATIMCHEMLFNLATYILIRLVDEEYWTFAYQLLKSLELYTHKYDAAFVILAAQVYIATQHAVKAVRLFQQTNIIYVNHNKWSVMSNKKDNDSRAKTMALLLDALCIEDPAYAYYLFDFLITDQETYYDPVDITCFVDKITTVLLRHADMDLIISIGRLIIKHDITLRAMTYRALITTVVRTDMVLAKQLYHYAITMGVYNTIKLMPVAHIIINYDWVEEELYLMFVELLQQLLSSIGHAIDHVGPNQLSVYLVFEPIPTEKDLSSDAIKYEDSREQLKEKKSLVKKVLVERFNPPIQLVKKNRGRICKLSSRSLVTYLSSGHYG